MESLFWVDEIFLSEEKIGQIFLPAENRNEKDMPASGVAGKIMKRMADIVLSLFIILLIFSWMTPLIAILIKLTSKGPVFFLQNRNGLYGKPFTCLKFRSMIVNEESDIAATTENDYRITAVGKVLRRYHLDEFPQFLNVLSGTMTIVGPRPHMIRENEKYERVIAHYAFRYRVKPGITGLGQVNNTRTVNDLEKMKRRTYWDTLYIKNWSPQLDIQILYRTLILLFNP